MKTGIACAALAAGVSAQVMNPYAGRMAMPAPYWATGARVAAPAAARVAAPVGYAYPQYNQATLDTLREGVTGVTDAVSEARLAQLAQSSAQYDYLSTRTTDPKDEDRYTRWSRGYDFQIADTEAEHAYKAFVSNPSRETSLASESASNTANAAQVMFWDTSAEDDEFGRAGRYTFQALAGNMELAEDALKHAERNIAFNDDAAAYYNALAEYGTAENELWEQTFNLKGDHHTADMLKRQRTFDKYNNAYDTYRGNPNQMNTEDLNVAQTDFTGYFFDKVLDRESISDILSYQTAQMEATNAAKRAKAAGADFATQYSPAYGQAYGGRYAGAYGYGYGR